MKKLHLIMAIGFILTTIIFHSFTPSNEIKSIKIGTQVWMLENLNVSIFRNGDLIPEAKTNEAWLKAAKEGKPAWCYYNNDPKNGLKYGKLYNWYAINDPRGLAPEGWSIPNNQDWSKLYTYCGDIIEAAHHLKSATGWDSDGKGGGSNKSGFTALPGGVRGSYEKFEMKGSAAYFATSESIGNNSYDNGYNTTYNMFSKNPFLQMASISHKWGISVRCIQK